MLAEGNLSDAYFYLMLSDWDLIMCVIINVICVLLLTHDLYCLHMILRLELWLRWQSLRDARLLQLSLDARTHCRVEGGVAEG
eukprot:COSAG01_NODE_6670_length_3554_cov_2.322431_3_plen_83_part_00